ncbi:MAG: 50S ribosomal protein L18 [Candidatus Kappaea frigidicola]|nr:50S ribosomal protein L18 [Candidatus Kappaea frigidicola]
MKKVLTSRQKRHRRVRKKISGTALKPRLNVFRSLSNFYAQLIDDSTGKIILSMSTLSKDLKASNKYGGNKEAAKDLGKVFAEAASKANIKECVFDRGGYIFHGRVKEFAEAAREGGLKF